MFLFCEKNASMWRFSQKKEHILLFNEKYALLLR